MDNEPEWTPGVGEIPADPPVGISGAGGAPEFF